MNSNEILKQLNMDYKSQCMYLKIKYGSVTGDYFEDKSCKIVNNKIKRASEGLQVHHIMEYNNNPYICNLSDSYQALNNDFEFQKSKNLVYCNLIEHLILHIKITLYRNKVLNQQILDGTMLLINKIEELYQSPKKDKYLLCIKDNKEDFKYLCEYFFTNLN